MCDTLKAFAASLDVSAFKVVNPPSYIFLCGGQFEPEPGKDPSVRRIFHDFLESKSPHLINRVLLAEKANRWYNADLYPNLLQLEEHLAGLSTLVLLFVESAGSIAELGAFCCIEELQSKLVAVIETEHYNKPSFIWDGPARLMREQNPDSISAFILGKQK